MNVVGDPYGSSHVWACRFRNGSLNLKFLALGLGCSFRWNLWLFSFLLIIVSNFYRLYIYMCHYICQIYSTLWKNWYLLKNFIYWIIHYFLKQKKAIHDTYMVSFKQSLLMVLKQSVFVVPYLMRTRRLYAPLPKEFSG